MRVVVLERRPILGGACVTEEVWPGPARLARLLRRLDAAAADRLRPPARRLRLPRRPARPGLRDDDPGRPDRLLRRRAARRPSRSASSPQATPTNFAPFDDRLFRAADVPAADDAARTAGARLQAPRATCSSSPARRAGPPGSRGPRSTSCSGCSRCRSPTCSTTTSSTTRSRARTPRPASSASGPGPNTPGTAYNLLHHALGELDGIAGRLGPRERRHGRDLRGDRGARARRRRGDPHRRGGRLDRRPRRARDRRDARQRRGAARARRRLRRAPEDARCSTSSAPSTSPTRSPRTCAATARAAGR